LKKFGKGHLLGTSNVHLAMKHDIIPMGSVAHEWYSLHGALFGFKQANEAANEAWVKVYQGDLGTALPDTFTSDVFLKSFNTKYAKLFDGVRQDSGKPLIFLNKFVEHYKKLRINSLFKMVLFSDNLKKIEQISEIHDECKGKINDRYGIGTWFSNDVGVKPLNMVIKLVACNFDGEWIDTVKLSDDEGKNTGKSEVVSLCKKALNLE
jgi:nicotinate phosphoribosyltransferase